MIRTIAILVITLASGQLLAQTMYVTDKFEIYMRTGESPKHRIVKTLRSGDEVTLVSKNKQTGYSQIKISSGKSGYVLTRQLLPEQVARKRIPELEAKIAQLETAPGELNQRLAELTTAHSELTAEHQALLTEKQNIEFELAELSRVSADAMKIDRERKELRKQVANMTHQIEDQKQQIRESSNSRIQRWFLIGGGVMFGGILLGLILPNLRIKRRKDNWGSL